MQQTSDSAKPVVAGRRVTRVALVGLPGTGKSAVGAALAQRLGWPLVDTDAAITAGAGGRSVAQIFEDEGEAGFRERERTVVATALRSDGALVLACGGGVMAQPELRSLLLTELCVVWLDGDDSVLLPRIGDGSGRPLLGADPARGLVELRRARLPAYATAHLRVDVAGGDVEDVCDRVADAVGGTRLGPGTNGSAAERRVQVALGERSYEVLVGRGVALSVSAHLPERSTRVAVVADRAVLPLARRVAGSIRQSGREATLIPVRGGDASKTWAAAGRLVERFAALRLDRDDCVVAAGGGSVGDLCGFAAATYLRGIAHVQLPTTLLAMVDSGLGGKTGVNLSSGKNLAGAFWQPRAVLCDLEALSTLGDRAYRAAFAEIVKYAMIADVTLAGMLDTDLGALLGRDLDALTSVVERCCGIKASVVAADERESGRRAILNYGHTVGHALEAATGFGDTLLHGEAVACGMRVAGLLSVGLLSCPPDDVAWQDEMLARSGLGAAPRMDPGEVMGLLGSDKKARAGVVRWVLVERRGQASFGHLVPEAAVRDALGRVLTG